jgi:hypothetical protein
METKVIRIEIKFTRATLALLLSLVLLLAGLGIAGAALAQPPDPGAGEPLPPEPEVGEAAVVGELAASGVVSSAINYQGRLTDNTGNPLDGTYNIEFQLWDAESGGSQVGSTITVNNVGVDQGLFNVRLEVDPDDFNGQELWLRVGVGGEWLDPRQQILPVPYALSLRPGAIISDTSSYVELNRLRGGAWPILTSYKYGVYAKAEGTSLLTYYYGVYGSGSSTGVYGRSDSGYGVYGYSATGTAIYGDGDVKQNRTGDGLVKAAVFANCHSSGSIIHRSFNNVNSASITIGSGGGAGQCTIDFGFDVSDRYVVASANTTGASLFDRGVTVRNQSGTSVVFFRYNADNGAGIGGDIAVLVY